MVAQELKSAGFKVYAAARRVDRMADLEKDGITPAALDLTRDGSIAACVNTILSKEKSIDVLVNNAGYGSYGAIEDVPLEEGRRQFEVNLFGTARLIRLVTPAMREQHYEKIVNISSMGGKIWTKFGGWYHADSEPITKEDTAVMKSLEGFSWNRRPIWVTYNGKTVAASMHTMPHMANPTKSNGFDGHFCIHLLNSKVHANSKACPRHQACVQEAYRAGKAK